MITVTPSLSSALTVQSAPRRSCAALALTLAVSASPAMALAPTEVSIPASADTTIYLDGSNPSADLSNGMGAGMFSGRTSGNVDVTQRGLIRFDLSAIPTGAVVQSAQVRLTLLRGSPGSPPLPVKLHRLRSDWGEGASVGGGAGAPSDTGDASWKYSMFPGTLWGSAGGDFEAAASATQSVPAVSGDYTWGSTTELVSDVTGWLADPSTNYGWIIINSEVPGTARQFASRDADVEAIAPTLILTYEGGATGCNIADLTSIGGTAEDPGLPDNQLTVDDIIVFVNLFSDGTGCPGTAPCSAADVCGIGGPPEPADGQLTVDDIIAFFNAFSDGC